jgi:hypothetical protein
MPIGNRTIACAVKTTAKTYTTHPLVNPGFAKTEPAWICLFFLHTFSVRQPPKGEPVRLEAKIFDSTGKEVDGYQVEADGEDFTFKFKKPHRDVVAWLA